MDSGRDNENYRRTLLGKPSYRFKSCPDYKYGEMAERSNAAVLKTVLGNTNGGSNPSLSANLKTDSGS